MWFVYTRKDYSSVLDVYSDANDRACQPHLPSPKTFVELCGDVLDALPLVRCWNWAIIDVMCWLHSLGFPQYKEAFETNCINGQKLMLVDADALIKMNIHDFDHIKAITAAIRQLGVLQLERVLRRLSEPPYDPETFFILYRVHYDITRMEFFYRANIAQRPHPPLDHWQSIDTCPPKYPPDQYRVQTWLPKHVDCDWEKRPPGCREIKD